jgi:YD repeat-containing protein
MAFRPSGATLPKSTIWLLALAWPPPPASAQTGPVQYGYDELGRLIVVVDGDGRTALYSYDAVGNLLAIQRIDPAPEEPVVITAIAPTQGKVGSGVSVLGKGFSAVAAQNVVSFSGGVSATVTSASPTGLRVSVPTGAQTGPISVTAPAGSATSSTSFRVIGPLTVTPAGSAIAPGATQQFSVSTSGGGSPPVDWAVNGIPDGNAVVGTISASGLYTAPAYVPQPVVLTISATDQGDLLTTGSTTATLGVVGASRFAAAKDVSVAMFAHVVSNSVQTSVSTIIAPGVINKSRQTSVSTIIGGEPAATTAATPISVTLGPLVTGVAPATGTRGTTVSVTLTGVGFSDATAVTFLRNNVSDSTISASLVSVSAGGTQATLQVILAMNAPIGVRVVQVTAPANTSTPMGTTGMNLFTVQ